MRKVYIILSFLLTMILTIYIKLTNRRPKISKCLVGKTALVTGGNEGIGYNVCLSLASRGCTVIIADRNDSERSRKKIMRETGNPNIISKRLDLASFQSVRELAKDVNENFEKLDILVNNAGIANSKTGQLTEDGLNPVMQINFFGHFLLTHLLLDLLKKSGPSRILFASSGLAFLENIDLNNLNKHSYEENYGDSKMAQLVASDYFAEKLKHTNVTSNTYHPGIVLTRIYNNNSLSEQGLLVMMGIYIIFSSNWLLGNRAWDCAEQIVHFAVSDEFEKENGVFFFEDRKFVKPSRAKDRKFTEALMKASENLVKLT